MARPKWLMRDFTNLNRIYKAHRTNVWWIIKVFRVHWSRVITCYTPSHAIDHLYQIWKESILNCRCYRADTIFKAKAIWPWRYRSRSKVIICNTPSHISDHLCQIWKESIRCRFFSFKVKAEKFKKFAKKRIRPELKTLQSGHGIGFEGFLSQGRMTLKI